MIGGAVQTRGGRVREMHPLKPLLIRGSPEYQQCSTKQFNMLRKYVDREPILCSVAAILDPVECPELEIEEEPEQGNES